MTVHVTLLGGFDVVVDGRRVPPVEWRRRQAAALVKVLALAHGRTLHREQVADALWPDLALDEAAPRLHKAAHYARRSLGDPRSVVLSGETVALYPDAEIDVDAVRFERLAAGDPSAAIEAYPGDLLPQDLYEPWAERARDRLRLLYLQALRATGRWAEVAAAEPGDESAHLALIRELAAAGDRPAALRQFERLEHGLRRELGVAPSREALALRDSLLMASPARPAATDLIGRDAELAAVDRLLRGVRDGRGRTLFVGGPAGIGKTALLTAVEAAAGAARMRIGVGVAARFAGDWPYAPVLEALADLCRRHPTLLDGLDDVFRGEIERALSGRQFSWDGQGAHQRLFVAAAELLRLAAAGAGALLVIDDAHDADEASVRLLHYLARSTLTERMLIAVGHRTPDGTLAEVRRSLLARGGGVAVDLAPLHPDGSAELARRHGAAVSRLDAIHDASGGLPFAVIELAGSSSLLPAGLPEPVVRALAAAAVLGSTFDTDEFTAVTGLSDRDAYAVLDTAVERRVVHRTPAGFRFRHALVRDALPAPGADAHRRAAAALERLGRSPARIGHHLVQAGRPAEAVPFVLAAAETEAALGAYRDALATLSTVRDAASGDALARLLALRADLLNACADLGAIDAYRQALAVASDPDARVWLRTQLARASMYAGDLDTAEVALAGLELGGGANDAPLLLAQGMLAYFRNDFAAADAVATEARRRIGQGEGGSWQLFDLIALQGLLAHHRGEWFQRLRSELRSGIQRADLMAGIFDSHLCVAEYLLYGPTPYDDVLALAAELRDSAERAGVLRAVGFALALRGEAALLKGDLELAETELRAAADLHHDLESPVGEAHSLQRLAEVHLARGDREAATRLLHRALPLARWSLIGLHLLHRIYGTMIDAAPDFDTARAVLDRAESTLGVEDRCTFCSIMLDVPAARLCADAGDLDGARRYLTAARRSEAMWEGTSWQASLLEIEAHIARAERRDAEARRLFADAAALFDAAGQPRDADRCRA